MSIYSEVRSAVRHGAWSTLKEIYIDEATAPIIFSHLSGAEVNESYVVINILSVDQIGHNQTSTLTNPTNQLSIIANYEVSVQFSFCGSEAGSLANTFSQRINNNPVVWEAFRKNKLGIMRKTQLRRAPQKRDTQWVEFFNMDVTFSYAVNTLQEVDVIEGLLFEDQITGETFTVPANLVITP